MAKTLHRSCDSRLLQSGLGRYLEPQKPLTPSLSQVPVQFGRSGIAVRLALRQNTPSERGVGAFAQAGVHDAPTDNKIRAMTRSRTSASIKPTLYKRYENPALQALLALATYPPNPGSALETYRTLGAAKARLVRTGLQQQVHALGVAIACCPVERRVASALGRRLRGRRTTRRGPLFAGSWSREKTREKIPRRPQKRPGTALPSPFCWAFFAWTRPALPPLPLHPYRVSPSHTP